MVGQKQKLIQLLFDAMCSIKFPVNFSIFFKSGIISVLYWIHCNEKVKAIHYFNDSSYHEKEEGWQ